MLPDIKVTCTFCRTDLVCQPDDLIGWDGDKPVYACNPCQGKIEREQIDAEQQRIENEMSKWGSLNVYTDADPGL